MHTKPLQLCPTLSVSKETPLSMGLSRQEHWSGLLYPPLGDLPNPGIEPASLMSPALADGFFTTSATTEAKEIDGCQRLGIEAGNDFKETWGHVLG